MPRNGSRTATSFSTDDFALYHPGGSLGRKLTRVEEVMRTGRQIRRAHVDETVREVFVRLAGPRRRSGAILIEDEDSVLLGIFTDSDLARLFVEERVAGPLPGRPQFIETPVELLQQL